MQASQAEKAGVSVGDTFTAINNTKIPPNTTKSDLVKIITSYTRPVHITFLSSDSETYVDEEEEVVLSGDDMGIGMDVDDDVFGGLLGSDDDTYVDEEERETEMQGAVDDLFGSEGEEEG